MLDFVIIADNSKEKVINYFFYGYKFKFIPVQKFTETTPNTYYLFISNVITPHKNIVSEIQSIIKKGDKFVFLTKDGRNFLSHSDNLIFNGNECQINKEHKFKILFSKQYKQYRNIYYKTIMSNEHVDFLIRMKNNKKEIFNDNNAYDSIVDYINHKSHHKFYHIIYFMKNNIYIPKLLDKKYLNITIVYQNLDLSDEITLKNFALRNNYNLITYNKNYINSLKYLWFERILFVDNKTNDIINNKFIDKYDSVLDRLPMIKDEFVYIKGEYLPYMTSIENYKPNIILNTKSFPIRNYKMNMNNINNNDLLRIKAYDILYNNITNIKNKTNADYIKQISMAVLCKKDLNIKDFKLNTSSKELYEWYVLLSNSGPKYHVFTKIVIEQFLIKSKEVNYRNKKIFFDMVKYLISQFNFKNVNTICDIIIYMVDVFEKKLMIDFILNVFPLVSRSESVDKFTVLLKTVFKEFKSYEQLFTLFPNNPQVIDLYIYLTTNFTKEDNLDDNVFNKRDKIKTNLENIQKINFPIMPLGKVIILNSSNFYLSYQGVPSRDIFSLKCQLFRKICPDLNYKIDTNFVNKKKRILFAAGFLNRWHSVFKDRHQVIKYLASLDDMEVFITMKDKISDEVNIKESFGNAIIINIDNNLSKARDQIAKLNLDIIVYCEIGMDHFFYFLSFMKLAKYQINTWGHSDTCGIDTIDFFYSSKLYELDYDEAQTHYSEKLVLMNSLCTCYVNPTDRHKNFKYKTRENYGFNDSTIIYFCAQSIFKFNKGYYDYINQILSANKNSVLIMIDSEIKNKFVENIKSDVVSRIHWLPPAPHTGFMNMINISDIVLDTFPFGGCNSSLEAFSLGKVVVTQPSQMINGRFTTGFYKKMNLDKFICNSKDDYIRFAIKLANKGFRNKLEKQIVANSDKLFMEKETLTEWEQHIRKLE